jgi:nucleoside-diphosphate-sugar epimerase
MRINFESTVNLLEALRAAKATHTRFLFASSSSIYASRRDGSPIPEDAPFEPSSPYAVSKLAGDACAQLYARAFGLDTMCFRPFFLIGPQKLGDVASDIARRIVAIERGAPALLKTGRTDTVRDMIDVRDGVFAIIALAERGQKGTPYNICSGRGISIGDLIAEFRAAALKPFEIALDPQFMRPVDELVRVGDPQRLMALDWQPTIPLAETAHDILAYWRGQSEQ